MADKFPATTTQLYTALLTSSNYIKQHLPPAGISIVLGSGLAEFYEQLSDRIPLDFTSIPYLPTTTVSGHKGTLFYGTVKGTPVYCWGGRLHGYEGYYNYEIAYIAHLAAFLGCHTLLVTNASGVALEGCQPGDIVLLRDHINHFCRNPLDSYLHSLFGQPHLQLPYSDELIEFAKGVAKRQGELQCFEGTYFWIRGPSYETPYEVSVYRKLGGNVFGMSTVPEIMAGLSHGMRVLSVAVVANLAAGLGGEELTHEMVKERISSVQGKIENFFVSLISEMPQFTGKVQSEWVNEFQPAPLRAEIPEVKNEHIAEAIRWVNLVNGGESIEFVFAVNSHVRISLEAFKQVYFKEIPHFPLQSIASWNGKLVLGKLNGRNVAFLMNCCFEGLMVYETYFIVQVAIGAGAGHLHYLIPAALSASTKVLGLNDYVNYHIQGPAEKPIAQPCSITPLGTENIIAFAGPSLPTPAETEMGRRLGAPHFTIANMALLNESGNRGLRHSLSAYHSDFLNETFTGEEVTSHCAAVMGQVPIQRIQITYASFPVRSGMETVDPPESPAEVEAFAERLRGFDLKLCVIASSYVGTRLLAGLEVQKSWAFKSKLAQTVHVAGQVLVIVGSLMLKHHHDHKKLCYAYFIPNLLGIKRALVLDSLSSVSAEAPLGSWVKLTDHIGLSYYNPLFGHNIEHWGVRFPDISDSYSFDMDWDKELLEQGALCSEQIALFTNPSRALVSNSLVNMAGFCGAKVVARNSVNAVIALGHRLIDEPPKEILSIGYVYYDAVQREYSPSPAEGHIDAIRALIRRLVTP